MLTTLRRLGGLSLLLAVAGCPTAVKSPTADVGPAQIQGVQTGQVVQLNGTASNDPQSRALSYDWSFVQLPQGSHATLNDPHSATPSFTADVPGTYEVQLTVANAFLTSSPATQTIIVGVCGSQQPVTGDLAFAPATPVVGTVVTVTAPAANDPDNAASCNGPRQSLTYVWRLVAQPAGSTATLNNPSAQAPSFTADVPGDYSARLVLTDSTGLKSNASDVKVTILACGNAVPTVGITGSEVPTRIGQSVQLVASAASADNQGTCGLNETFSYLWTVVNLPQGSRASLNSSVTSNPSFTPDAAGTYSFSVVVTASNGLKSLPRTVDITLGNQCGANVPVVTIAPPASALYIGSNVQLTAAVTDDDANSAVCNPALIVSFTYAWSLFGLPSGSNAHLNNAGSQTPTFVPDVGGNYTVQLTVTASTGVSKTDRLQITVAACGNRSPVISALTQTTPAAGAQPNPGGPVVIAASASSPDNSPSTCLPANAQKTLSYEWTMTNRPPGSSAFIQNPTLSNATFNTDVAGTYQISLVVTDSTGLKSTTTYFPVTTTTCGLASPTITALSETPSGGRPGDQPNPGQTVTLSAATDDVDNGTCALGQTVSVQWTLLKAPQSSGAALAAPNLATTTFTPDAIGTYQFQAVATDSTGRTSGSSYKTFTTTNCGSNAPTVRVVQSQFSNATPLSPILLSATPDSVDNNPTCFAGPAAKTFTYAWHLVSGPQKNGAVFSDPSVPNPTFTPDQPGAYQLSVTVTDSTHLSSAPAYVDVTVSSCGIVGPSVAGINTTPVPASTRIGTPVTLSSGFVTANNCLVNSAIKSVAGPYNIPAGATLAVTLNGALYTHNFDAAVTTAADVVASINNDARFTNCNPVTNVCGPGVRASVSDNGTTVSVSLFDSSGLGGEVQAVLNTDANQFLQFPRGRNLNLSYAWNIVQRPPGSAALLDNPAFPSPTFTPDKLGSYQLSLVVTNTLGFASDPVFLTITPAECSLSPIAWGDQDSAASITRASTDPDASFKTGKLNTGAHVTFTAHFTDPNKIACGAAVAVTPYSYRWALVSAPPGSRAPLSSSSEATPSLIPDVPGTYQVSASVSNALGNASSTEFLSITTELCGANVPAVLLDAVTGSINSNHAVSINVTGGTATDADADTTTCANRFNTNLSFSYVWSIESQQAGVPPAVLSNAGVPTSDTSASFEAFAPGTYTVQVIATASTSGLSSLPGRTTFTVASCGATRPVITNVGITDLGSSSTVSSPPVGSTIVAKVNTVAVDASCSADQPASYSWRVIRAASGSSAAFTNISASSATAQFSPDVAGTYTLGVTAISAAGLSSNEYQLTLTTATCGPTFAGVTANPPAPFIGQATALSISGGITDSCTKGQSPSAYAYRWTLVSRPGASQAGLATPAAAGSAFTPDAVGTYQFQLVVTDSAGNTSAPASLAFTSATCGSALPTATPVTSTPAGTIYSGDLVTLALSNVADANAATCGAAIPVTPFIYSWKLIAAPLGSRATLVGDTTATPKFVADLPGNYQIASQVTDALGNASAISTQTVAVSSCGFQTPAPSISTTAPGGFTVNANSALPLVAAANDPDDAVGAGACPVRFNNPANAIRYTWAVVGGPANGKFAFTTTTGNTTANTTRFSASVAGNYLVQLLATDATGLTGVSTQTIAVSQCGASAPSITGVTTPVSRPAVGSLVTLNVTTFDADTVAGGACGLAPLAADTSITWSLAASPAGSTVSVPASANGLAPLKSSFTFTADFAGTYVFNVVASDSTGLSSAPMQISVPTGGCGPGLGTGISYAPAGTVLEGEAITFRTNGTFTDSCIANPPAQPFLSWSLLTRPPTSTATISSTSSSAGFTPDVPGTYQVQVLGTDLAGFSSTQTFTLSVGTCSATPSLGAITLVANEPLSAGVVSSTTGANKVLMNFGNTAACVGAGVLCDAYTADRVDLAATVTAGTCPSGSASNYTYAWSLVSKPLGSTAALSSTTTARPVFTTDQPNATYQVALTVTDGNGNSAGPVYRTIGTAPCGGQSQTFTVAAGANTILSTIAGPLAQSVNTNAALALSATTSGGSGDNQNATATANFCPARFAMSTTFNWAIATLPAGGHASLSASSSADAAGLSFQASAPSPTAAVSDAYLVNVIASGSNGIASAPVQVAVTANKCGAYAPAALDVVAGATTRAFTATQVVSASSTLVHADNDGTVLNANLPVQIVGNVVDLNTLLATSTGQDPTVGGSTPLPGCGISGSNGLTVLWSLTAVPAGSRATLSSASTLTPSFLPDQAGTYKLQLTSTSALGATTQTFSVTTNACGTSAFDTSAAAVATQKIGASTLTLASTPGFSLAYPITASQFVTDTNTCTAGFAKSLSYAWSFSSLPAGSRAQLSGLTTQAPSFIPDSLGTYRLVQTVTNSTGQTATLAPISMTVTCGGAAATVASLGLKQGGVPSGVTPNGTSTPFYVNFPVQLDPGPGLADADVSATYPGANCAVAFPKTYSYAWGFDALPTGSNAKFNDPAAKTPSFTPDVASSSYTVRLTVTDSLGHSSQQSFPYSTGACNSASPTATIGVISPVASGANAASFNNVVSTGLVVQLGAAVASTDALALPTGCGLTRFYSYQWSLTGGPIGTTTTRPGSATALSSATLSNPTFVADLATDPTHPFTVQLIVTDNAGHSSALPAKASITAVGNYAPVDLAANLSSTWFSSAVDPMTNKTVLAVWDPTGVSGAQFTGAVKLYRCDTQPCTLITVVDTNLGQLSGTFKDDPVPVSVKVTSSGEILVAYFSTNATPVVPAPAFHAAACAVTLFSYNGGTASYQTLEAGSGCNSGGTAGKEFGRWLSLALDGNGTWAVAYTRHDFSAGPNAVDFSYCKAGCGPSAAVGSATPETNLLVAATGSATDFGKFISLSPTGPSVATPFPNAQVVYTAQTSSTARTLNFAAISPSGGTPSFQATAFALTDTSSDVGRYASLVNDGNANHVAYYDNSMARLVYQRCDGASTLCNASAFFNNRVIVDGTDVAPGVTDDIGTNLSLAVDSLGVSISYLDLTKGLLKLAQAPLAPAPPVQGSFTQTTLALGTVANSLTTYVSPSAPGTDLVRVFYARQGTTPTITLFEQP